MTNTTRRDLLAALGAVAALPSGRLFAATTSGDARPFSWDTLKAEAAARAPALGAASCAASGRGEARL